MSKDLCYNCGKRIKGKRIAHDISDPWNTNYHIVYLDQKCWDKVKPKC